MSESECCASGSCEVCRRPNGYGRERREQLERDARDYEPPWVREHRREGWGETMSERAARLDSR